MVGACVNEVVDCVLKPILIGAEPGPLAGDTFDGVVE